MDLLTREAVPSVLIQFIVAEGENKKLFTHLKRSFHCHCVHSDKFVQTLVSCVVWCHCFSYCRHHCGQQGYHQQAIQSDRPNPRHATD